MGTIGATFYLIGIGLVYMMDGYAKLSGTWKREFLTSRIKVRLLVAAGFITIGLALKAAVFPLHAWLPNALYVCTPCGDGIFGRLRHKSSFVRFVTV